MKTTIADTISGRFDDDGQCFETDGRTIEDVCSEAAASIDVRDRGLADESKRFDFADGSSIVVGASAWDLGLPGGCHCWASVGHTEECGIDRAPERSTRA